MFAIPKTRAIALALAAALVPTALLAAPKTRVATAIVDVGTVAKGEKIRHRFEISNAGDEPLEIREVKPACGCTVAEYDRTIAPGASGAIEAVVDTANLNGAIAKGVTVFTNDAANPRLELTVKALVRPLIEARPGYARFIVVEGEKHEASVQTLWSIEGPELEILGVESPYPFLKVSFTEAPPEERGSAGGDRQWRVKLALAADAPVGPLADHVLVATNHPRQGVVEIPVSGFVRPVLSVTPRVANFGRQRLAEPYQATLEVRNLSSGKIAVTGVSTDIPGVDAAVEPVEEGRTYRVQVTLQPTMAKGDFRGKLVLATSSPRRPAVEVELLGTVL